MSSDPPPKSTPRPMLIGPLFTEVPEPICPGARALYDLWRALKPADDLPSRSDFTLERVQQAGVLGHFFVIEPIDDGRDWKYRLMGVRIVWLFGRDVTNIPFTRHMFPDEAERSIALSNDVARTRQPLFLVARFVSGQHYGDLETLSLPVWSPDRSAVWLIGASFATGEAARFGPSVAL